ncbi:PiggyBac transposable element-derived protein 4 [Plakobranchus ocellatus]|uniref:PiggyBac transposable element-derived protein 4 n=1 Tax=Plakobranchus ocellatus TaxID=259542 RepID=A0AAV4A1G1_9GAST|nr:PiggyBac transposable element-derived protein 4 [Plakobranchus ocellatus]
MRQFTAICMHMRINPKPTLHDYWTRHPALHSSFCRKVMPRERFLSILAFFHIADNSTFIPFDQPDHDPVHKIRPFITHLNDKFKELYSLGQNVCIDEAMIPFKGRSRFRVYMKDKPTKWGFKLYEICESGSGYVYSFEMYCADKRISNKPIDVTMRLMEPILNKGHRLFLDNYYCCPALWTRLQPHQTMMVGTCRKNRLGMPADLFQGRQHQGDLDYRRKGQLIVTRWFDKREVVTLSTLHKPELRITPGRFEVKEKPLAVIDYIRNMSGVDHSDQLISFFPMRRKSQKWWKKPFFHLLTLVSIQTTILLNKYRRQHGRRVTTLSSVVKELIVRHAGTDLTIDAVEDTVNLSLARLHERHFIKLCPPTGEPGKARRQCKVCTDKAKKAGATHEERKNKRKLVPTWCPECKVGLCLDCFELYHMKADYTK